MSESNVIQLDPYGFQPFPKMARLSRNCVITEKLDGTNAQIFISEDGRVTKAGSRNRWLAAGSDNYGFFAWAQEHAEQLVLLGPGRHFGEWWGHGIQRGYGQPPGVRRFSLFNTHRWCLAGEEPKHAKQEKLPPCVGLVPVLASGIFSEGLVNDALLSLGRNGSKAAPGFMNPEGIVIYHEAAGFCFKKTIHDDASPKSLV